MSETVEWIDADGVTLTLSGPGVTTYQVDWGVSGRYMPKIEVQVDSIPGRAGGVLRGARHGVHEFVLPLSLAASTESSLRTLLRSLVDCMDPTRGQGRIRVTSPLGDQREITCAYAAGLEMEEKLGDSSGPGFQACPLAMVAYDPYWYDVSPVSSPVWTVTDAPTFFPILPIRLTASELVVDEVISNSGSVEAWPVWTIRGPGADILLTNQTTGQYLQFKSSFSLGDGQFVTIDTRPGVKAVTLDDGTNLYDQLEAASSLWPLRRGDNAVRLEMSAVTAVSSLQVSYWRRYLAP
jgi:phage-related protein